MSAARLPYYQQPPSSSSDAHRRRSGSRGRGQRTGGYTDRKGQGTRERTRSTERRRSRSRSVERRRSRSRSMERHRRRNSRHHQPRHRESRSRERSRDRERSKRSYYQQRRTRSRSRSGSGRRQHGSKSRTDAGNELASSGGSHKQQRGLPEAGASTGNHRFNAVSAVGAYYNLEIDEPVDKERIHREMDEKLRETLAREGKVYPPPKPEPAHPVFANDGSFMELFKKMQEQQQQPQAQQPQHHQQQQQPEAAVVAAIAEQQQPLLSAAADRSSPNVLSAFGPLPAIAVGAASSAAAPYIAAAAAGKTAPPPPMVRRRRGGKILKTGVVAKLKTPNERDVDPKDFWSLYLAEVNKYKSNACDTDNGKRPLVK